MFETSPSPALEGIGYRVIAADGLDTAMEIIGKHWPIDLLLIDIAMPEVNGIDVARAILTERPKLPVLFMTGYAGAAAAEHGEEPFGEAFHGHRNSGEGGGRLARHQRSDFSLVKYRSHQAKLPALSSYSRSANSTTANVSSWHGADVTRCLL